jgi:16S rRNA processing protein RimM
VRITAYTDDPMALAHYRALKREDGSPALTLASARPAKGGVIARCPEVATKEAADALRGLRLYVPRAALPPPEDEDEFYLADLIGLPTQTTDGAPFGRIKAVHNFGAGDILEIDPGAGRPTLYLPFTREAVPEVRLAEGRVIVAPPAEDEATPDEETPE